MNSAKRFLVFKIFSAFAFAIVFTINASAQTNLSQINYNLLSGTANINTGLSRPRVYNRELTTKNTFVENSVRKPVTVFDLERNAFVLLNYQRAIQGLNQLEWNEEMAKVARVHSEDMANKKFFSHTGSDGSMVSNRADALGINKWQAIGENIAYNRGFENPVEFAVERWMQSPSHKQNLLSGQWKESGVGIAVTNDGTYYFTQVFILRK